MIVGILIRGFKAYKNITYVPLTNESRFTAFIGDNGCGKSSILEALNYFFIEGRFNRNKVQSKQGSSKLEYDAFVCPVFALCLNDLGGLDDDTKRLAHAISTLFLSETLDDNSFKPFQTQLQTFNSLDGKIILPLARYFEDKSYQNYFPTTKSNKEFYNRRESLGLSDDDFGLYDDKNDVHPIKKLGVLRDAVQQMYSYLYIPVEADEEELTKLENVMVQKLTDKKLTHEIHQVIKAGEVSNSITTALDKYLEVIQSKLNDLVYHSEYRKKFTPQLLVEKVIEGYFSTKT